MVFEIPGYQNIQKVSGNAIFTYYRGQRGQDQAYVLIKVLNQPDPDPKHLAPLWQEFEILRLLDLPGVEKAYALENHQQWWMIILEDFGGRPINELPIAGCMEPREFLNLALQLTGILEEIHTRHVIHKHISPANISYNIETRQARLTNFEFASLISKEKVPLQSPYNLTTFLAYISPEMTGRMNRLVDYRTDYYSLGITLYELLTGTAPFIGDSPLELVHAHLAISPDSPAFRMDPWISSPTAFWMVSAVLFKLLAKGPENRYQTTAALQFDLRQCLSVLNNPAANDSEKPVFVPGLADRPVDLHIPQVVIGREQETEVLVQAFLRTIGGPKELVLVSGEAGVGKTTLVNQLIRPVTERNGLFLYAKFDQARHLYVYHILVEVLDEFCRLVLCEPAPSFKKWREIIQAAVAPHGQLLTDICPQLEKIIGPQPAVAAVDETSARPRFHQVIIRFLQAVCRPDHNTVIFLDDMQWISADSCLLWQSILTAPGLQNLLVVGTYRHNELDLENPIQNLVTAVENGDGRVSRLHLDNLDLPLIQKLVETALATKAAEVSDLAALVYRRTGGNPYFSNEFIKSIYKDGLLVFNSEEQKWNWDANRIEEYGTAGNVVDFFVHEIAALDEEIQKMLQYAALIGRRFNASTLLAIFGQENASSLADCLWQAMTEGFIHPLNENYRYLAGEHTYRSAEKGLHPPRLVDLLEEKIDFEFQHDRVQQAAILMLDDHQRMKISLQIGRVLLEKAEQAGPEAVQENLLSIVDHINMGGELIDDTGEAVKSAQLNLMASSQARSSAAFQTAFGYLSAGIKLLPENSWQDEYSLSFELYSAGAEVALLNGDLAAAEELVLFAEANVRTLLEKAWIIRIRMEIYTIQNLFDRVVDLGVDAIQMLGFDLEVGDPLVFSPEQAVQLPDMTDPHAMAVSQLVDLLVSAAFARNDPRFPQLINFFLNLFSRYGNAPTASFVYISYAVLLFNQFDQLEQGCQLARMALELAEKKGPSKILYSVRYVYYAFIHHWSAPARDALIPLREMIQLAFESGNQRFSNNAQDMEAQNSLFVGIQLEQVRSKQVEAVRRLEDMHMMSFNHRQRIWAQVVLNLMGENHQSPGIYGELFPEDEARQLINAKQNQTFIFNFYVAQTFMDLIFRESQRALENSFTAKQIKLETRIHLVNAQFCYYDSLALLSEGLDPRDLADRLIKAEENLVFLRLWASLVPENFLHQLELVEAELARCQGREREAAERYEWAIRDARKNGYIHDCALAAELATEFDLARGNYSAARDHLSIAYYSYLSWGSKAKGNHLINRYPEWLPPASEDVKKAPVRLDTEDHPMDQITSSIDLNTILHASLELAHETDLEELLRKLITILIETAGAQNGSLILWRDNHWYLEVQGSTDPEQDFKRISTPLDNPDSRAINLQVPASIIHYVINSEWNLVMEDASISYQFSQDPYIQNHGTKSILCAPLLNQDELYGIVYLENNLTAGAFTSDRLKIVQLISGQAAVSIENARLYENMEALVAERTRELSDANEKLKEEIEERARVEEALRYKEALLRKVLEILPVGVWILDKNTQIVMGNPEGQRIWAGLKYLGMQEYDEYKAWRLSTGERVSSEKFAGALALSIGQITLNEELEIEAFDGTRRIVLNSAMPLYIEEDGLVGAISVNQDITELKRSQEDLQKAHAQLSSLLEISQTIVSTLDLDRLLNIILEQLGKVLPFDAAAILIPEQDELKFRLIQGPPILHTMFKYPIPIHEETLVEPLLQAKGPFYVPDLLADQDLLRKIQGIMKIPYSNFAQMRSWLGQPLIAKDDLVGVLLLAHSQPNYYSAQSQVMSQAFANQVAIAIQNAQLFTKAQEIAAIEERNRLARELHDSVAQALYSISLYIDATRMALETNKLGVVKEHLGELTNLSREAMSDMRLMIFEMRPPVLEKVGLASALQSRLDSVESRAGFHADMVLDGTLQFTQEQENELYRIAQESLNNVLKHARADHVNITLKGEAGRFRMVIEDNGIGFDQEMAEQAGGQGLRNIQERAEKIGASCVIESAGKGAKIIVEAIS